MNHTVFQTATGGHKTVPSNWMSATAVAPLIAQDGVLTWLQHHGAAHGFEKDSSPYEFLSFIGEKGRQFEEKWIRELAPHAVRVCAHPYDVGNVEKFKQTLDLMRERCPVIFQPAIWWEPGQVYGTPDLIVLVSWLRENFPDLLPHVCPSLAGAEAEDHYVVLDIKFTSELDSSRKAQDLNRYAIQLRIYTYILAHLQNYMPLQAFIICRDRLRNPLPIAISSTLNQPLDRDLLHLRDVYLKIKLEGGTMTPWQDHIVAPNSSNDNDAPWHKAKSTIMRDYIPGKDAGLLYYIGVKPKAALAQQGFTSLQSMLDVEPERVPLETCPGLGKTRAPQIRAILRANRTGLPIPPAPEQIPQSVPFEFFVDFEFFTNVNVNFERDWPSLSGCPMVFMIGVGYINAGKWEYICFASESETPEAELKLWNAFLAFLKDQTGDRFADPSKCALYHWTYAEPKECERAAARHALGTSHPILQLPWVDLNRLYLAGPCGVPGAYGTGLKEVANALGRIDQRFDPQWPGALDQGLTAMVMGWFAYKQKEPLTSEEMQILNQYLEADCRALWKVLSWMRSSATFSSRLANTAVIP
jgi:uncharacterized protein